jgi:ribosomal protein L40E
VRTKRQGKALCVRCGAVPPTNGSTCRACLDYLVAKRCEARARARLPREALEELAW